MNELLLQAVIYLGAGVIAVPIAHRLGLGSVLGYLLAARVAHRSGTNRRVLLLGACAAQPQGAGARDRHVTSDPNMMLQSFS